MPKDCQNVFMVEVVSLILGWKIDSETQQATSTVVLIAQIKAELKLFQLPIQLIHFDDCIQCDLTIQELIRLIKARRTLAQFTCTNR